LHKAGKRYAKTNTINYEIIFSIAPAGVIVFVITLGCATKIWGGGIQSNNKVLRCIFATAKSTKCISASLARN